MLAFPGKMNNDNPVSDDLNLGDLRVWYLSLFLITSNLPGIKLLVYSHKLCEYVLAGGTFIAVFCSLLYHICQTTDQCFGMNLPLLTLLDHISAPVFMVTLILFFINNSSARQNRRRARIHAAQYDNNNTSLGPIEVVSTEKHLFDNNNNNGARPSTLLDHHRQIDRFLSNGNPQPFNTKTIVPVNNTSIEPREPWYDESFEQSNYLTDEQFEDIEGSKMYYNQGFSMGAPNTLSTAWDVYILLASIFVAIIAALAHPFSMQAFIILILFNMATIFFKIAVIEQGVPVNMYGRLYLPDLLLGILMIAVSLVFYILDCFWAYAYTHSLWHILSFLGAYFVVVGLSRNVEGWYSPTYNAYRAVMSCCLREKALD